MAGAEAAQDAEAAQAPPEDGGAALRALLSIEAWADRDIPEPDRLLGDLVTTTTRVFLVGRTGLGKTMLGIAMAAGAASGTGFLQWASARPARVLYLDGEMPAELIKPRARDALRRLGDAEIPAGNLVIFGRDIEDEARRLRPNLPPFAPLNTLPGRKFLLALMTELGGVDLVIFDNVMSLIAGDQKDEESWSDTLPLVTALTDWRVGQIWLDHTGHNSDRQDGSSTKAWRFDAVGCMTPLEGQTDPRSTAFVLSFDHPGKARRRTPDNWRQFEPRIIRLQDDAWASEPVELQRRARSNRTHSGPPPSRNTRPCTTPWWCRECPAGQPATPGTPSACVSAWPTQYRPRPRGRSRTPTKKRSERIYRPSKWLAGLASMAKQSPT